MMKRLLLMVTLVAVAACGRAGSDETALADSLSRDLELAPVDTLAPLNDAAPEAPTPPQAAPAPKPRPAAPRPQPAAPAPAPTPAPAPASAPTLPASTVINATARDSLTSRRHKPGHTFVTTITDDLRDSRGRIVVPAGAELSFTVKEIAPSENKGDSLGVLVLQPSQMMVDGRVYAVSGTVDYVEVYLKGRGVTAGDAAKVGAGAAIGAIAGRVIGGKKGTIIGGVVGGAAGTAHAVETADRDVVVPPGAKIQVTLTQDVVLN